MQSLGEVVGDPPSGLALVRQDRRPGRDLGQLVGVEHGRSLSQELDAAVEAGGELDPALPLEGLQVIGDRRLRDELEGSSEFRP